jgi:hypothetical protein
MKRHLAIVLLFTLTASLWAVPDPGAEEIDAARQRYAQWRRHPDKLARLRQYWQSFLALPAERREQILHFDQSLHEEPSTSQARLWNVLERYTDWYNHLSDQDRQKLQAEPDKSKRLALIREMRDSEWMKGQAKAVRVEWAAHTGKARADFVTKLRQEERQRHLEWQMASRFWKKLETHEPLPARAEDLPQEVQKYVRDILLPMLEPAELERLKKSEGSWPAYPMLLVELADRHPPALKGPHGPTRIEDLPEPLRDRIYKMKDKAVHKFLDHAKGRWPEFGTAVADLVARNKNWPPTLPQNELWPQDHTGLKPPMQKFVMEILPAVLTNDEKLKLLHCPKSWPEYPQLIQQLAQAHHLQPPWHSVPEAAGWDPSNYRLHRDSRGQGYPEVPAVQLRQFALYELDPAARAQLNLSPTDPMSGHRLKEAYFKHRQEEMKKLRQMENRKGLKAAAEKSE